MSDDLLVPFVSDVAFGLLLLSVIVAYLIVGFDWFIAGCAVGISLGYAVHVGSHMFGYSLNANFNN